MLRRFVTSLVAPSNRDSFYELWNRFGPEAARTAMIPYVWQGKVPRPSEFYGEPEVKLMYRRPQSRDKYEVMTDVLDDILIRLENIENKLDNELRQR